MERGKQDWSKLALTWRENPINKIGKRIPYPKEVSTPLGQSWKNFPIASRSLRYWKPTISRNYSYQVMIPSRGGFTQALRRG